jgi:hypothetical protein
MGGSVPSKFGDGKEDVDGKFKNTSLHWFL